MNIFDFLDQEAGRGKLDSSDGFTLNSLRARAALSEYQLPDPGWWLVKLVQGAVALEAEAIHLSTARLKVQFQFTAPDGPGAVLLLQTLLDGTIPKQRPLCHLVTGLRGSLAGHTKSLICLVESRFETVQMTFDETTADVVRSQGDERLAGLRYTFSISRPKRAVAPADYFRTSILTLVRNLVDDVRAVETRCWCSPVPVAIDGRRITTDFPSQNSRALADLESLGRPKIRNSENVDHWLAVKWVNLPGCAPLQGFVGPSRGDGGDEIRTSEGAVRGCPTKTDSVHLTWPRKGENSLVFLSMTGQIQSGVDFILDGVVVAQKAFRFPQPHANSIRRLGCTLGFRIFRNVDFQDLDLTQTQLRNEDDIVQSTLLQVAPAVIDLIETVRADVELHWPSFRDQFGMEKSNLVKGVMALVAPFALPASWMDSAYLKRVLRTQGDSLIRALRSLDNQDRNPTSG